MREGAYSVVLAAAYAALAGLYIIASGHWASTSSTTVDELAGREAVKGIAFVATTALLLGLGSFALFRRLRAAHERIAAQREALVRAERAALAAQLASSIAHDFKNQLTVAIAAAGEFDRRVEGDADAAEALSDLKEALDGATQLATNLSKLGSQSLRPGEGSVELDRVARDSLRVVRRHPHLARCRVEQELRPASVARAQPTLLAQAIINLLLNAGEAVDGGGRVLIRVSREGAAAVAEIHDDGPGVPPDIAERIFDPFFTTKQEGTGLGLLSVRTCAERNGGTVHVSKSPLGGACFQLRFPAA